MFISLFYIYSNQLLLIDKLGFDRIGRNDFIRKIDESTRLKFLYLKPVFLRINIIFRLFSSKNHTNTVFLAFSKK